MKTTASRALAPATLLPLLLFACNEQDHSAPDSNASSAPSVSKDEYDALAAKNEQSVKDLSNHLHELNAKLLEETQKRDARIQELSDMLSTKEAELTSLRNSLDVTKGELSDCRESNLALRTDLRSAKSLGSAEYAEILDRSKTLSNEESIRLYQAFVEQFPSSPAARKAQSRINHHLRQIQILKNRSNARPLRIWNARFQAARLATSTQARQDLETLLGRKPDSSKRAPTSEVKVITYVWKDCVSDLSGGFRDLLVETEDDRIIKVRAGEELRP